MVGYTNAINFKPGDFCYIVVYTIVPPEHHEKPEFLEGMVTDVDKPPVPKSLYHPLWKYWSEKPAIVRSISAMVTADPRETQIYALEPVLLNEEPKKDYLVITPEEHDNYHYKIIERQAKMNHVQLARIRTLEEQVRKFRSLSLLQE